ncbi:MAG: NAD-dependent epimerase/dehydratase family protein [Chloroflexi bacterium]|nr:NAD-dependent epimerase/dehydratase family protein [Chloroflexota bacterium]
MAHYLVTGVAGFIASRVAHMLLDAGHHVLGVDDLNEAYDVRLKAYRLRQLQAHRTFRFLQMDVADWNAVDELRRFGRYDGIIHLAARAGVRASLRNPWIYYRTNVTGTVNMLEFARRYGVPKVLLASTSSVYAGTPPPFREDAATDAPLSPYAASKKSAEVTAYAYHHLYDLDITVLRYFTVYGPAGRPDMSPLRFTKWICEGQPVRIFGDGTQQRDFTYIDDIARGTVAALNLEAGYEIINLGNDAPRPLLDLVRLIEQACGRTARLEFLERHPADMPHTWASIAKARRLLGWEPRVSLEEGVERLVAWYRAEWEWLYDLRLGD